MRRPLPQADRGPHVGRHEPLANVADGRRFHLGVFVGVDRRTGQYMVHDGDTVRRARAVIRLPEANQCDKESLSEVCPMPWDPIVHVNMR